MTEKCSDPRLACVEENYKAIAERVAQAAVRSGRRPEDVTLLAATKTVPPAYINHAIACGLRCIGENRVQELLEKYDQIDWSKGVTGHMLSLIHMTLPTTPYV